MTQEEQFGLGEVWLKESRLKSETVFVKSPTNGASSAQKQSSLVFAEAGNRDEAYWGSKNPGKQVDKLGRAVSHQDVLREKSMELSQSFPK
jgi:hypothetical protein|tara:strand:- start:70 stop:342 length:273 start_codon:yes stop_codon:yes gene_type:complete